MPFVIEIRWIFILYLMLQVYFRCLQDLPTKQWCLNKILNTLERWGSCRAEQTLFTSCWTCFEGASLLQTATAFVQATEWNFYHNHLSPLGLLERLSVRQGIVKCIPLALKRRKVYINPQCYLATLDGQDFFKYFFHWKHDVNKY